MSIAVPRDRKPPRRTAVRILETALDLFNRRGEAQVSPNAIAAELRISPGNLYYHYPSKDALVVALAEEWLEQLEAENARRPLDPDDLDGLRTGLLRLLELTWDYRFLMRNLADLMARSLKLETLLPAALAALEQRVDGLLDGPARQAGWDARHRQATRTGIVLTVQTWFLREFSLDPRHAADPARAAAAIGRGRVHLDDLLRLSGLPIPTGPTGPTP